MANKCPDCGFELSYPDEDAPTCYRCESHYWQGRTVAQESELTRLRSANAAFMANETVTVGTDYLDSLVKGLYEAVEGRNKMRAALEHYAAALAHSRGEWTVVGDGLPILSNQYLVTYKNQTTGVPSVDKVYFDGMRGKFTLFGMSIKVIAWMPLPEPYTPDTED